MRYQGNEENRRLGEGNEIACALGNFGGPEWEQPTSMSVEIGETEYLMIQPKCLLVGEQGTGNTHAKLLRNEFSPSFINGKEMLQDKAEPDNPGSEEETGASVLGPEAWFKGLVEVSHKNNNRGGGKGPAGGKWTEQEDKWLRSLVEQYGPKRWKKIAGMLGGSRSDVQCLHRWNKVLRPGLQKGPWTEQEDAIVKSMVTAVGVGKVQWNSVAAMLSGRLGKQCRERWLNFLDPSIKRATWTDEEDNVLFESQRYLGNRWCEIVKLLPGRPENSTKNRFNSSARKKWNKAHPVGSKSTINPKLLSALKNNQKVVWLRQEQKKAAKKTASPNIWPISTSAVQPLGYRKEAQAHVNLPEISLATEANVPQTTEWCHHQQQQHINQLQSMPPYGSIDVEDNNSAEVVADKCVPDFPAGQNREGIYSGGTGNLNIHHTNNNTNSSVNSITSDIDRKIALNMLCSAQQQQPSLKKHKRDGSDHSLISETTMPSIGTIGTIGTPQEYGGSQNRADQQHFDSKRLRPESAITFNSEIDCINEVARRANGVFIRDFVPFSLIPYFKYLNDEAKQGIMRQLSEDRSMRSGMLQPDGNHSLMLQQKMLRLDGGGQKNGDVAYNQQAMSWSSLPDNRVQDQVNQMDTHTEINI